MATMSYISVIQRYHEYEHAIQDLLASIMAGISEESVFHEKDTQCNAMRCLGETYPFVDLLYVLDKDGIQISDNVAVSSNSSSAYLGKGKDRSQRPYFMLMKNGRDTVVTKPYLSTASRKLNLSVVTRRKNNEEYEYLVLDCDLACIIEFLMGDTARRNFQPVFKLFYSFIAFGLFVVVALLMWLAMEQIVSLPAVRHSVTEQHLRPFSIIIYLTLGLAVFDLGKTTLEEEVLMHKDIFRHSSTRRTITRFIAAILIAVSIESLLLMFKAALGESNQLNQAVWMMLAAVGLLVGLGIYVYLGARAEAILLKNGK
jgi:hypothetical protein